MPKIWIAFGSNLEKSPVSGKEQKRSEWIKLGVRALSKQLELSGSRVNKISPFFESQALLRPGAPLEEDLPYLNGVLEIETSLDPLQVLGILKGIEVLCGRDSKALAWAPRTLDLDIIEWEGGPFQAQGLQVPHPRAHQRNFVLWPLARLQGPSFNARQWGIKPSLEDLESVPLALEQWTQVMGILNGTFDSFSDGGLVFEEGYLHKTLSQWYLSGVTLVDLGFESTRPGSNRVGVEDQWKLFKKIEPMLKEFPCFQWSLDTTKVEMAQRFLDSSLGSNLRLLNDVEGVEDFTSLLEEVPQLELIQMHHNGVPPIAVKLDPTVSLSGTEASLRPWWNEVEARLGGFLERVILDPGFGFGKTPRQHMLWIEHLEGLHKFGQKICIGVSRKSFLKQLSQLSLSRDLETVTLGLRCAQKGMDLLRVHNPVQQKQALEAFYQSGAISELP